MRKYGIPASVILAQGILESANGQSALAQNENNHFGIKATQAWIEDGGKYGVYSDDKPDEKFCSYESAADSYEHHSQFLVNNQRYADCFGKEADDYKGWAQGLEQAGYATGSGYGSKLVSIIESNGLQEYDRMVMEEMSSMGKKPGQDWQAGAGQEKQQAKSQTTMATASPDYSFPLKRDEFLFVTSPFGMRSDPTNDNSQQMHKGVDIRANYEAVLATEMNGRVVSVNQNSNTGGGKSVTVEYQRDGGDAVQCTYMHLSDISVKVGDTVNAGQQVGVSGNTGTRTTGPHLHFGVRQVSADGTTRDIDPSMYLAEIAQRGNIQLQALYNGQDLLEKYKEDTPNAVSDLAQNGEDVEDLTPDGWMKKLLSSEDSGLGISGSSDPIVEMAMTMFASLMMLAVQIDSKEEDKLMGAISDGVSKRTVDLTPLVQGMRACELSLDDDGKAVLRADNGTVKVERQLTSNELSRLSTILNSTAISEEAKSVRISGIVNTIVLSQQASQNFELGMAEQMGQNETLRR